MTLKSLPKGLKDLECKKGTLTVQPPLSYVPPINLHEKRDTAQIKVKLPNGTNFQMSPFGQGNTEDYLVHVIAIKRLLEQKGTTQDVGKAFQVLVKMRKQLELLLETPEGNRKSKKDEQRKTLSMIKEDLKGGWELAVAKTLEAYKLFHCFVISKA
jgi:hypothetical protein